MTVPGGFETRDVPDPKVALVSGGGSGIGREVARRLAAEGYTVAILGRRQDALEETAQGTGIHWRVADVTDAVAVAEAIAGIAAELGPVDIVIANAGYYPRTHFVDQAADEFSAVMRINIEGVANVIRPVLATMLNRNCGRIVVMGSLADMNPIPGAVAYSASKGALHALVKGIAAEIDPFRYPNVLVNEMSPGATRTAMSDFGKDPADVAGEVLALVRQPSGSGGGRFFQDGRERHPGESWKGALKRRLGLSGR